MEKQQPSPKIKLKIKEAATARKGDSRPQVKPKPMTGLNRSQKGGPPAGGGSGGNAGNKQVAPSPRQPVFTPRRGVRGGPVFKQIHIKFRYSDAVNHYAHQLISDVRQNPQVKAPPAPTPTPDVPTVEVHHPEKLDFERVFTKVVPVEVENGRLCITPKPGVGEGRGTRFVFSVLSHHRESAMSPPNEHHLAGGQAVLSPRAASCPPPKNSVMSPRLPPEKEEQAGYSYGRSQISASNKKVCFCLPSIERDLSSGIDGPTRITSRKPEASDSVNPRSPQKVIQVSGADLVSPRTKLNVAKVAGIRLRVKLPPIGKKVKPLPNLLPASIDVQAVA